MNPVRAFFMSVTLLAFGGATAAQAQSEVMISAGRGVDDGNIDVLRLAYRRILARDRRWWVPTLVEFGGGIWRLPERAGRTERFDLHATPIWRFDYARIYVDAGIGVYLLSHTINSDTAKLSTSFEFGSHVAAGVRIGERRDIRVGIALQHLSNGGIKEPNSGVDLVLLNASFPL
jgi:lipid A 3-O-deacylase